MVANRVCHVCLKKITHPVIFSNLSSRGIVKSLYVNICYFERTNGSIFIAEVNSRCFHWFPAAITVSLSRTQIWRFHSELYKFVWNILTDNSSTEYRTDLGLGKVDKLLIAYNIQILDYFYSIVLILFSRCVTVKTSHTYRATWLARLVYFFFFLFLSQSK